MGTKASTTTPASAPATQARTFDLTVREEKKHSVLFKAKEGEQFPLTSAYVMRDQIPGIANAKAVRITIEAIQ